MLLTFLPMTAFAAPETETYPWVTDTYFPQEEETVPQYDFDDGTWGYQSERYPVEADVLEETVPIQGVSASAAENLFEGYSIDDIRQYLNAGGQIYQYLRVHSETGGVMTYQVPVQESELEYLESIQEGNIQPLNANPFPVTRIRYSGRSHADSIVIILLGDGFTPAQHRTLLDHANDVINAMENTHPFGLFSHLFTVYLIHATGPNIASPGASYLGTVLPGGRFRSAYETQPVQTNRIRQLVDARVSPSDQTMIQVISNASNFGGWAQYGWHYQLTVPIAVVSIQNTGWGGNSWHRAFIHEFGHSFGQLVDEHSSAVSLSNNRANSTTVADADVKWRHWNGYRGVSRTPIRFVGGLTDGWAVPSGASCIMGWGAQSPRFCGVCSAELIRRMALISGEIFHGRSPSTHRYPTSTSYPWVHTPEVRIPPGATRILDSAFHGNASLNIVRIPASVTSIGDFAFIGATRLNQVIHYSPTPQRINSTTFAGVNRGGIEVFVPFGTRQAYIAAGWTGFATLTEWTPPAVQLITFNPQGGTWPTPGSGTRSIQRTIHQGDSYARAFNASDVLQIPTQNPPTRTGYTFTGWWTAATGGTRITSSTMVSTATTRTLHAQWASTAVQVVTFNPQGGTWPSPGSGMGTLQRTILRNGAYAQAFNSLAALQNPVQNAPTRSGYNFNGWWTAATGGTHINSMTMVSAEASRTLHAQWVPTQVVTFNPQGGTWPSPGSGTGTLQRTIPRSGTYNLAFNASGILQPGLFNQGTQGVPTRTGYTFAGWFNAAIGGTRITNTTAVSAQTSRTLHAQWVSATRRVIFNPQGGAWPAPSGGTGNLTRTMNQSATSFSTVMNSNNMALLNAAQNPPTRTGYAFAGWFTAATGGIWQSHDTPVLPGSGDLTLHARWTPLVQVITFNPQGGTWPSPGSGTGNIQRTIPRSGTYAQAFNATDVLQNPVQNPPTRTGYTFTGWFTTATGGARILSTTAVSADASRTLHARWTPLTRTIVFSPQGGTWPAPSGGTGNLTRTMNQSAPNFSPVMNSNDTALLNAAQNPPIRTGYTFVGWFNGPAWGTRMTHNTVVVPDSRALTLYAQWTAQTRTVTFNPQGGTWPSPASGTGNVTRTMNQSVTSFSTVMNSNNTALLNAAQNPPTRTGYTFAGWFNTATGGTRHNHNTPVLPGSGDITLHAQWTRLEQVVTFNPQGGTWPSHGSGAGNIQRTIPRSGTYAQAFNASDVLQNPVQNPPIRTGYTFAGWWTAATGGARILSTTAVSADASRTLHAQWTPLPRTVTFNPQGGTWPSPASGTGNLTRTMNQSVTSFSTVMNSNNTALLNAAQNPPTRTGYTFAGWFNTATGGTRHNHNTAVIPGNGAITLHAQWTAQTRTVTFNPQGGTWPSPESGMGNLTRTMNQSATSFSTVMSSNNTALLNAAQNAPTRTGYTFEGWFTTTIGGIRHNHNTAVTPGSGDIILHAQWTRLEQVVTFNPQGGTWPSPGSGTGNIQRTIPRSGTYAQAFNASDVLQNPVQSPPTRIGYTFAGWWTAATGGIRILSTTAVSGDASRVLHAQWTPLTQVITFNPQGGTWPSPGSGTGNIQRTILRRGTYAQAFSALDVLQSPVQNLPTRAGYAFTGWWTAATGGTRILSTTAVSTEGSRILHAQWTPLDRTIVFNPQGGVWPSPASGTGNVTRSMRQNATDFSTVMSRSNVILLNADQNPPIRTGYTFAGWFEAATGGTRVTHNTAVTPGSGDIILHAQWTPQVQVITFNPQGGTWPSPGSGTGNIQRTIFRSGIYAQAFNAMDVLQNPVQNPPTRTGYTFTGWWTAATGGTRILSTTAVSADASRTLHAQWTPLVQVITFNPQGGAWSSPGSGTGNIQRTILRSGTYGQAFSAADVLQNPAQNPPTRTGYTFTGWWTAATGGARILSTTAVSADASRILHAQWTPLTRTVVFNPQGGTWPTPSGGVANLTRTMNQSATSFSPVMNSNNTALLNAAQNPPTRTGYIFAGWFNAATGGTRQNHDTAVTPGSEDIILHAQWTPLTQIVTFNSQGGTWPPPGSGVGNIQRTILRSGTYAQAFNVTDVLQNPVQNPPTRAGYAFTGWWTAATGGTRILNSTAVSTEESRILYAQWVPLVQIVSTWAELRTAINAAPINMPHTIEISDSFSALAGTTGNVITIPVNRDITLVSNTAIMRTLTQTNSGQRHFRVLGELTLDNGIILSGGIEDNANDSGGVQVNAGGTFTMNAGSVIEHCRRTISGGAVEVAGSNTAMATFELAGGTIRNNGTISFSRYGGGGVLLGAFSEMTMSSGAITGNAVPLAPSGFGGGGVLMTAVSAAFTMSGGTINGNTSTHGGGLRINAGAFAMNNASARIEYNTATNTAVSSGGGGIFQAGGTVTITAGEINDNSATNSGGGVRVTATGANAFTMTGGAMRNNRVTRATGDGGAIFAGASTLTANPLPENALPMLDIRAGVIFTGNTAGGGQFVPPANATTETRILATSSSVTGGNHPLNNYDINFRGVVLEQAVIFNPQGGIWSSPGSGTGNIQRTILRSGTYDQAFNTADVLQNPVQDPPIRTGYTFTGWWTAATSGAHITSDTAVSTDASRILHAQWMPEVQVVTFNPQGGIWSSPGSGTGNLERTILRSGTYGQAFNAADVIQNPVQDPPARTGYTFAGWWTAAIGGTRITSDTAVSTDESRTLYAQWAREVQAVNTWAELRTAVNEAPINVPHIIEISDSFSAPAGTTVGNSILIPATRNITLVSNNATMQTLMQANGGQRHFRVNGQLTLSNGITLSGGIGDNTNNSGGVQVNAGGTFTMNTGSVIEHCMRTISGGAVEVSGSNTARATFQLAGGTIQNNGTISFSRYGGGGVLLGAFSEMAMSSGAITGNDVPLAPAGFGGGGVLMTAVSATFTMSGGTISGNSSTRGGGLHVNAGTFTMNNATARIEYNTATNTAISGGGGGIFQAGGTVTIIAGEINNNSAINSGGGVRVTATGTNAFTMTGGAMRNNRVTRDTGDGGAIFAGASTLTANPLPENSLSMLDIRAGVIFAGNTAGGGQFAAPINATIATRILATSSSVSGANHPLNNYDINFRGVALPPIPGIETWDELRTAVEEAPENVPYMIRIADDLTTATAANRDAIVIPADRIIVLTSSEVGITRNVDMLINSQRHFTVSGQLALGDGITLRGGTTAANTNNAGGIHVSAGGTLTMLDNSIIQWVNRVGNTWVDSGGALNLAGTGTTVSTRATFIMEGGTIQNNSSGNGGGGILIHINAYVALRGGVISGNQTVGAGGGLLFNGGSMTMTGGTIRDNTAETGGGVAMAFGTFRMDGGTIEGNTANEGGGVRVATIFTNSFTMTGGVMRNNRATAGDGGAIFAGGWTLMEDPLPLNSLPMLDIRDGVIFEGNTASAGWATPPENATIATRILATSSSVTGANHPLNNFDINFRGSGLMPAMEIVEEQEMIEYTESILPDTVDDLELPTEESSYTEIVEQEGLDLPEVSTNDELAIAVQFVLEHEFMSYTSESDFAPNEAFSRETAMEILYRLAEKFDLILEQVFSATMLDHWFSEHVTRREFIAMLYRVAEVMGYSIDVLDIDDERLELDGVIRRAEGAVILYRFMMAVQ